MRGELINLVHEGLSRLNPEGNFVEVNESYAELVKCSPEDLIGKSWLTTVYPDDIKSAQEIFQRLLDGEDYVQSRLRGVTKNGRKFERKVTFLAIYEGKSKKPAGYYIFSVDVQHQIEARRELQEISSGIAELKNLFERYLDKK